MGQCYAGESRGTSAQAASPARAGSQPGSRTPAGFAVRAERARADAAAEDGCTLTHAAVDGSQRAAPQVASADLAAVAVAAPAAQVLTDDDDTTVTIVKVRSAHAFCVVCVPSV